MRRQCRRAVAQSRSSYCTECIDCVEFRSRLAARFSTAVPSGVGIAIHFAITENV